MRILIFILGLFSLGCDKLIKEDRSVCPCILTIDLTNINKDINKLNLWVLDGDDVIYNDTIPAIYFGTYSNVNSIFIHLSLHTIVIHIMQYSC